MVLFLGDVGAVKMIDDGLHLYQWDEPIVTFNVARCVLRRPAPSRRVASLAGRSLSLHLRPHGGRVAKRGLR